MVQAYEGAEEQHTRGKALMEQMQQLAEQRSGAEAKLTGLAAELSSLTQYTPEVVSQAEGEVAALNERLAAAEGQKQALQAQVGPVA